MLDAKLQLKPGQTIAVIGNPAPLELAAPRAGAGEATAVLIFVATQAGLQAGLAQLQAAAGSHRLTWLAYPKGGRLGTDLNRDIIRALANAAGLDPVRQIAIDETWSGLRLKALVYTGNK